MNMSLTLSADYWQNISITPSDIELLQNHLFETETPSSTQELAGVLVEQRIDSEREAQIKKQQTGGDLYLPKEHYKKGQKLIFPALEFRKGEVVSVRPGNNPQHGMFDVIDVLLDNGVQKSFAAALEQHALNEPPQETDQPENGPQEIVETFGEEIEKKLNAALALDESLVQVAGRWFPHALLVDINAGHLNLAEAIMEMAGGAPQTAASLMEQVELPQNDNTKLTEFSLNYALQEDGRFDEVGPAGQVLWCLKRLEPQEVQQVPPYLKYNSIDYDRSLLNEQMLALEADLDDELSEADASSEAVDEVTICLSYPHWRAGTLPISPRAASLFPTAYESPRIRFTLVDGKTGDRLPAWVVREHHYVYGLREWYEKLELFPGSYVDIRRGETPDEVIADPRTRRPTREWIRTVLAGTDGGLVFAILRQSIACDYDERRVIFVPDLENVDQAFSQASKNRQPLDKLIKGMLRELSKLTPQGHVHAEELYSALNILRRVPPAPLLAALVSSDNYVHIGDLYFRLAEMMPEEE